MNVDIERVSPGAKGALQIPLALTITGAGTLKGCFLAQSVTLEGYPKFESAQSFQSQPIVYTTYSRALGYAGQVDALIGKLMPKKPGPPPPI